MVYQNVLPKILYPNLFYSIVQCIFASFVQPQAHYIILFLFVHGKAHFSLKPNTLRVELRVHFQLYLISPTNNTGVPLRSTLFARMRTRTPVTQPGARLHNRVSGCTTCDS